MRRPGVICGLTLVIVLCGSQAAEGMWGASATGPAATKALALLPPTNLSTSHPNTTGAGRGYVSLGWTASASAFATGTEVQRATAPACASFAVVGTATSTSFTDTTAAYNQQYCYRVAAVAQSWRAPTAVGMALSLPPTSGVDTTGGTSYALSAIDRSGLSVDDGVPYTTQAKWARGAVQHVELGWNPAAIPSAPASVRVTLVYQSSLKPPTATTMQLLVSPDDGGSWVPYSLTVPAAKDTDVTSTVDVTPTINTGAALAQMRLRFLVGVPSGGGFFTSHDLAHVDVN